MSKFKPTDPKTLKVGDKIRVLTSDEYPGSQWTTDGSHPIGIGYPIGEVCIVTEEATSTTISSAPLSARFKRISGNQRPWDASGNRWPVVLIDAADTIESKEKTSSKYKEIPAFPVNFRYNRDMMTKAQEAMVVDEVKEQVRSWVLNNYREWPFEMDLKFTVQSNVLKTEWKENK